MNTSDAQFRCCDEYGDYQRSRTWSAPSRRDFLKTTAGLMAAVPIAPHMLLHDALLQRASTDAYNGPILVVIQFSGGNDGLNTIVPYGSSMYYRDRPTIAVPAKSVLPLDNMVGMNPNLAALKPLYDTGKIAIVQGVGYPNPSRSHFQSTDIWESADPSGLIQTGWLGRYLDATLQDTTNPLVAVALGSQVPRTLQSERAPVLSLDSVDAFKFAVTRANASELLGAFNDMYDGSPTSSSSYLGLVRAAGVNTEQGVKDLSQVTTNYKPAVTYPNDPLSRQLQLVAQFITAGLGTRVFHVSLGGFDDHAAEVFTHARLIKSFAESVNAFHTDLEAHGKADQVTMMTFSEFGRRVKENGGLGTDHGTAGPMFVIGNKVKGGLYGTDPVLQQLDANGDLVFGVDFRSVYGTVLDKFLNVSSTGILRGSYETLPIL